MAGLAGASGRIGPGVARLRDRLLALPRHAKRTILVVADLLLLTAVLWVALSVRYRAPFVPSDLGFVSAAIAGPLLAVATLWYFGIYKRVTRFIGRRANIRILAAMGLSVLFWTLALLMLGQHSIPRSAIVIYAVLGAAAILVFRLILKLMLESSGITLVDIEPRRHLAAVLIYGAGQQGIALLHAVRAARNRHVLGFIDSSPDLWRQYVGDLKVYPPSSMARFVEQEGVREILVALPADRRRREVLRELEQLPVAVKILPTYEDVSSGHVRLNSLRAVEVGDILGRDAVPPDEALLKRHITGKSILVTGAGGSIGSELVRQIVALSPRRVVLLDISESALYDVEFSARRLSGNEAGSPDISIVLGSTADARLLDQVIVENGVETIYHAAAYKHVPIVEQNPFSGLENNVFGTVTAAACARRHGVERFVLVSTDKAVRPTNVMGASKRLAELVLQAEAAEESRSTVFTMVRFGNVLESSGSVVPLFRRQIEAGGPITVTHPDVTRFFMSIPEAAELVIQSGAMARGGEVFVLHMGEPVRIADLARLMVRLSNLEVRDATNPDGDIEIAYIGLRPGEKLYEELLIGAHTQVTEHPRIFKSDEPCLSKEELAAELLCLRQAIDLRDRGAVDAVLTRIVEGYRPGEPACVREPALAPVGETLH